MAKINKRIEIVVSSRRGLGSMGPKSRKAIWAILSKEYAHVDITIVNDLPGLVALALRRPDMVFLGTKFIPSNPELGLADPNKIWISKYLDGQGIRYTGSGHRAITLELNKHLAKRRIAAAGLRTPRFQVISRGKPVAAHELALPYPLFVKPTNRGGGLGVDANSLVHNIHQLRTKVRSLSVTLGSDSLVEEYLPGREFSVGILKDVYTDRYSVMPIELVAPMDESGARFLTAQVKVMDAETYMGIADDRLKAEVSALAIDAFQALGARDYGRIDIRLDAAGVPHFLEANLLPSLVDHYGNFPKACLLNMGLEHEPMILKIVSLAFSRGIAVNASFRKSDSTRNVVPSLNLPELIAKPL